MAGVVNVFIGLGRTSAWCCQSCMTGRRCTAGLPVRSRLRRPLGSLWRSYSTGLTTRRWPLAALHRQDHRTSSCHMHVLHIVALPCSTGAISIGFLCREARLLTSSCGQDTIQCISVVKRSLQEVLLSLLARIKQLKSYASWNCVGQVHRAVLQLGGQPRQVVVKVRHPGVAKSIAIDFRLLKPVAAAASCVPSLKSLSLKESLAQFSANMTAQVCPLSVLQARCLLLQGCRSLFHNFRLPASVIEKERHLIHLWFVRSEPMPESTLHNQMNECGQFLPCILGWHKERLQTVICITG